MKIAVISDIHGNLPALEAVIQHLEIWRPDQVVVNGDIVNRGPNSSACLDLVREKAETNGWLLLRGNHEEFVVQCAAPDCPESGPEYELLRFARWCSKQLNGRISYLQSLPEVYEWTAPDGAELRVVHGSMRSNRDGIYPDMDDTVLRERIAPAPAVFVAGHTHRPLIRRVDDTQVVNVGAVGSPFDGDRRLSYGQFTWTAAAGWQSGIVRLPYDYEQIERDYVASGFLSEAGPMAKLMLTELRQARGLVYLWAGRYQEAMMAGEISIDESVCQLLRDEGLGPFQPPLL